MPDNKDPEKTIYPCRICGLDQGEDMWNPPQYGLICGCCFTEFNLEDDTLLQVRSMRKFWLTSGAKWCDKETKPANWNSIEDLTNQLKNIPHEWW